MTILKQYYKYFQFELSCDSDTTGYLYHCTETVLCKSLCLDEGRLI